MRLQFHHGGLQFFFVTLTLEGRPQALSRLAAGEKVPVLLPAGEVVKALLLAMHKVFPAVTISDRAIMPDHIHFLMIVRYDRAPTFNPLWASFVLMHAIEAAWAATGRGHAPEPPGKAGGDAATGKPSDDAAIGKPSDDAATGKPSDDAATGKPGDDAAGGDAAFDAVALLTAVTRCERAFAARLEALMRQGLSRAEALARLGPPATLAAGARGPQVPVRSPLRFDRRAYIELSFDGRQLKTIRHYIRLNHARALWKRLHPDRFRRFANIGHAILDPARTWSAMGNLTLLGSPFLRHVRLTLKKSLAEHEPTIAEIVAQARRGVVPVSGFISPGEVELLKRLKATPNTRFIKMLPCSLPPHYDPSAEDSRELAADRMLLLSGFTNTPHVSPLAMRRDPAASHLFRANCLVLNDLAAALCEKAQRRT